MPKVSIVLPVHNGSRFLRGAIDSCLKQTHRDIELIIVDDCSTDATPDIVRSFDDARMKVIRNGKNQRLPRSLNIGFRQATGDYLTWTSDDNEYEPSAIEKMLGCLKKDPGADFVYADYWALDEGTGKKKPLRLPDILDLREKNQVGACFLYTRRVYEKVGDYNPHLEMVEDYDYWIRTWKKFKTVHCAESLYLYRYHEQSLTTLRHFNQDLFIEILRYRNGYASPSKLGWTAAYYFDNVRKLSRTRGEKRKLAFHTLAEIRGLSFLFFIWFCVLVIYFSILKCLRGTK